MAHFDYIKPGGVWSLLSLLSSGIMAEIDRRIYKSINGDEGGVWAPTPTAIIIGGLGLQVTGPFTASNANITIKTGKFLTVESGGTANFLSGSAINLAGETTVSGPLSITSGTVVESEGDIELIGGSFTISSPTSFTINTATTLGATITVSGGAGIGVANTGNITWQNGALANYNSGSIGTFATGSTLNVNGALAQGTASVWTLNGTQTLSATAVLTTAGATTITLNNKPTLNAGMSIGATLLRTSSFQDHLRLYEAPNANGSILFSRDVVQIPGDLGTSKTYKVLNPFFSLASDECIIKHVVRSPTTDSSDALLVRDDISSSLICTLTNTNKLKGVTLVYSGATSQWSVLSYSGVLGTDILL